MGRKYLAIHYPRHPRLFNKFSVVQHKSEIWDGKTCIFKEPKLLKGKGMCPPEDCGGIGGYAYLLDILSKKRKSAEDKERLEWFGIEKGYDPNEFDFDWAKDNLTCLWLDAMGE